MLIKDWWKRVENGRKGEGKGMFYGIWRKSEIEKKEGEWIKEEIDGDLMRWSLIWSVKWMKIEIEKLIM